MSLRIQLGFWCGIFALFLLSVWLLGDVMMPFVLGAAIAYLLEPLVARISGLGLPRWAASLLILVLFLAFVVMIAFVALPPAYRQMEALAADFPAYIDRLFVLVKPYAAWLEGWFNGGGTAELQAALQDNLGKVLQVSGSLMAGLAGGGQAVAGFFTVVALTPIVAFFMMMEWPHFVSHVESLYPRRSKETVCDLLSQIDRKIAGFVRGQISVALVLAVLYAGALTVANLKYGFLIGLAAGIMSIIPLLGSTLGLVVSVVVAWFQSGDFSYAGLIAGIFIAGQVIEGNVLTPKLIGKSVGMHPLWILFALMAGASLSGILGMLLAVPVASAIGVLGGFAIMQYRDSPFYTGAAGNSAKAKNAGVKRKGGVRKTTKAAKKPAKKPAQKG